MANGESSVLSDLLKELSLKQQDGTQDAGIIASKMLAETPRLFVETYWKSMTIEHILLLKERIADAGFFTYYSRKIRNFRRKDEVAQRNRRFLAMKALMENGEFFTLGEMKTRDPVLYDELVGQLLSEGDVNALAREEYNTYNTASQMLLGQIDHLRTSELYYKMLEKEGEILAGVSDHKIAEEVEEEEEEEEEEETEETQQRMEQDVHVYSAEEKKLMTREFVSQMEERFISGADDAVINYREVSGSDLNKIIEQDKEDAYFELEEAVSTSNFPEKEIPIVEGKTEPETKVETVEEEEDYMTMDLSKL